MIGIYVHVPFCTVRCTYCDFYLMPGGAPADGAYAEAVAAEIASVGGTLHGREADTVHFGGGTPSLLPARSLGRILEALRAVFALADGAEIALEANPEDIAPARLAAWASLGFDRVAIGVQSLDDRMLRRLGRPHDAAGALRAVAAARRSPLRSVAADVMLGLPGEDPARTHAGLACLVDAGVDHLSLYLLEVHPRTRLGRSLALGRVAPCPDDRAADLYETAAAFLAAAGFEHYEISNFARPGHRSRHNQKYWTDADYVGFGPSAHSYVGGRRFANAADLRGYLRGGGVGAVRVEEEAAPARRGAEALIAGLRLLEGVDLEALRGRHGAGVPGPADPAVRAMIDAGFLQAAGGRLRLTAKGRLVSNEIFERLIS